MIIQDFQQKNGTSLIVNQKVIIQQMKKWIFLTRSIESSLCDYSYAYILVTGNIAVNGGDNNTKVAFKNCVPFEKCRTEINETFVEVKLLMLIIFQIICHHLSINQVLLVIQKIME